jgi:hypothetical protein
VLLGHPTGPDAVQLLAQQPWRDHGAGRPPDQSGRQHLGQPLRRSERQQGLADARAVGRHPATDPRVDPRPVTARELLHVDHVDAVRHRQVHGLVRRLEQVGQERGGRLPQPPLLRGQLTQLEQPHAQPVPARGALDDVPGRAWA